MCLPSLKTELSCFLFWAYLGLNFFITNMSDVVLLPQGCEFLPVKQLFKLLKTCVFVLEVTDLG